MNNFSISTFSKLTASMIEELFFLDRDYFNQPWDKNAWLDSLHSDQQYVGTLLTINNHVVGFSLYAIAKGDLVAHLLKILVAPSFRAKGYSKKIFSSDLTLMTSLNMESVFLEVEAKNNTAIALYQSLGFKLIHKKRHYYSNGDDALIFQMVF